MKKSSWLTRAVVAAVAAAALPVAASALDAGITGHRAQAASGTVVGTGKAAASGIGPAAAGGGRPGRSATHWQHTWTSMPQLTEPSNMPPAPFTQDGAVFVDSTLRQTAHVSLGGDRVRLRFSNAFGGTDLPVTAVSVALPESGAAGARAIRAGTSRPVTFAGRASTTVPVGAQMLSDPLDFTVAPGTNLTVTMYLATGQQSTSITSHPGSRTTSYMLQGDHLDDTDLPDAASVAHWYFLSGIEVQAPADTRATVVLGDSLTDGRGSTDNRNDRWPDRLRARLQGTAGTAGTAVLNQAAGGNRILHDGLGPGGLARLDRDVFAQSGVTSLIVFEGVNDIGTAEATPAAQKSVTDALTAAYEQIVVRAHAQGLRVYGATLTPFGGNDPYDDPAGLREESRQAVNTWIRGSGRFDAAVVDLDKAARDPQQPQRLRTDLDVGDHLHLNPAGYQVLADAFPLDLFQARAVRGGH